MGLETLDDGISNWYCDQVVVIISIEDYNLSTLGSTINGGALAVNSYNSVSILEIYHMLYEVGYFLIENINFGSI